MNWPSKFCVPLALLAVCVPQAAKANDPPVSVDLPTLVSDEDLDKLRGGFVWSGLDIGFGADIRTFVNGELVLETVLTWANGGAETTQTVAAGLTPVDAAALDGGILSNGNIRMKVGDSPVYLLNDGRTAIAHETANGVRNMVINTARGFNSVQEIDATLDLSGYQEFNTQLTLDRLTSAVGDLAGQAAIGALGP